MPALWDVYFATADIDATVMAGGSVLKGLFDIAGGAARMAVLQGPPGAEFEVMEMVPEAA